MQFTPNGVMYDDIYEMYYELFNTIGLSINKDQYLYDQDTGVVIKYNDKYIKATNVPMTLYAGRNDIVFEPQKNYNLMVTLFGYFMDKETNMNEGCNFSFIAQGIEDNPNPENKTQRLTVRTSIGDFSSHFYSNLWLGYAELIFVLGNQMGAVDLSNFDVIEEENVPI